MDKEEQLEFVKERIRTLKAELAVLKETKRKIKASALSESNPKSKKPKEERAILMK